MSEENSKKTRKFYKKKRYTIPAGFLLLIFALGIWADKDQGYLIDECNKGSIEKCKELEDTYTTPFDSKEERAKITNPYFKEKFKKLDAIEEAIEACNNGSIEVCKELEKKKAEEKRIRAAEREALEKKKAEEKRIRAAEQKRYEAQFNKIILCKMLLQENLKDPSSFKD